MKKLYLGTYYIFLLITWEPNSENLVNFNDDAGYFLIRAQKWPSNVAYPLHCFLSPEALVINASDIDKLLLKAEDAARDSRRTKQDHYDEMRRKKDEEREAHERMLVSWWNLSNTQEVLFFIFKSVGINYPGRRSNSKKSKGGRSCCIGVWKMERSIFCWCWRDDRKWSARWKPRIALWFCGVHQGDFGVIPFIS